MDGCNSWPKDYCDRDIHGVNLWVDLFLPQAALLEKELSGYDATFHIPSRWDRKSSLAPSTPMPPPSTDLIPSGLDLVIRLETAHEQALGNQLGRRVDSDGQAFHLDSHRPFSTHVKNDTLSLPDDDHSPNANAGYRVSIQLHPLTMLVVVPF